MSELRLTQDQLDRGRRTISGKGPFGTPIEMREAFNRALQNASVSIVIVDDENPDKVLYTEDPPTPDDVVREHIIRITTMARRDYGLYLSGNARAGLRLAFEEMFRLGEEAGLARARISR